jgi:hypothetical protein
MIDSYDGGAGVYDLHDNLENAHAHISDFDDFSGSMALSVPTFPALYLYYRYCAPPHPPHHKESFSY